MASSLHPHSKNGCLEFFKIGCSARFRPPAQLLAGAGSTCRNAGYGEEECWRGSLLYQYKLLRCGLGQVFLFPPAADGFEEGDHIGETSTLGLN